MVSRRAANRLGCHRRELAIEIGLKEWTAGDSEMVQTAQHQMQLLLRLNTAQNEMRMLVTGAKEIAC